MGLNQRQFKLNVHVDLGKCRCMESLWWTLHVYRRIHSLSVWYGMSNVALFDIFIFLSDHTSLLLYILGFVFNIWPFLFFMFRFYSIFYDLFSIYPFIFIVEFSFILYIQSFALYIFGFVFNIWPFLFDLTSLLLYIFGFVFNIWPFLFYIIRFYSIFYDLYSIYVYFYCIIFV